MSGSDRLSKEEQVVALIDAVLAGNRDAFRGIHDLYLRDVRQILHAFLGAHPDMDDLVQTTFIELYRSLGAFERRSRFSTWLYRVTMNVAMQHLRKARRRMSEVEMGEFVEALERADPAESAEKTAEKRELVGILYGILDTIAPKKREVFILHEMMGLSPSDMAERIGISVHTAKSRLFHARREFYERWDRAMRRDATNYAFLLGRDEDAAEEDMPPSLRTLREAQDAEEERRSATPPSGSRHPSEDLDADEGSHSDGTIDGEPTVTSAPRMAAPPPATIS